MTIKSSVLGEGMSELRTKQERGATLHELGLTPRGLVVILAPKGVACTLDTSADFGQCPEGTTCMYFDANPSHGINSFDSVALIGIAFIQAITFDDWATPMYALMASFSPCVWKRSLHCGTS